MASFLFLLRIFIVTSILTEFTNSENATDSLEQKPGTLSKGRQRSLVEERLRESLLEKYDKSIMPNGNNTQVFMLKMEMILTGIQEVDVRHQRLHVSAWLKMEWWDSRLTWNVSANGDLYSLPFSQEDIYLPEIFLFNRYRVRNTELFGATMAVAYWHGEVIWLPAASLEVPCAMDLSTWPYDTHECTFIFGHASRDNSTFEVYPDSEMVSLDSFASTVVDWQVINSSTQRFQYYFNAGDGYDNVRFNITVRRHSLPFIRSLFFAPQVLLLASLLIFWIVDVNFRVFFAVAELTSSLVFGVYLWNIIPPAHTAPNIAYLISGIPILILLTLSLSLVLDALSACSYPYPSCLKVCVGPWHRPRARQWSRDVLKISHEHLVLGDDDGPTAAEENQHNQDWNSFAGVLRIVLSVLYSIACGLLALLTVVL